jgi:putative redox protein
MKIKVKLIDEHFNLEARNDEGNTLLMDASKDIGGQGKGMRPMQVVLSALAGCSAIDVINILKKQKQKVEILEVEVSGDRQALKDYSLFKSIEVKFTITGKVDAAKAERAVELAFEKYCSVAKLLEATSSITYSININ